MKLPCSIALGLFLATPSWAQDCGTGRYDTFNHFSGYTVEQAVIFGSNTGVSGGTQTLRMDVYEPEGDLLEVRPVILVAFGGSFISGSRADVASLCQIFARMGYVAIAPDYRVGFFLPNQTTTTRAVMRGAHDMKACVRYLRKTVAEDGNPYRIDPDRIIVGGVSAGAISAIHATYLNEASEIPTVLLSESASLGGVEGNSGSPDYSSEVFACYSFSGAIGDTSWVVPGDKPLASVHEVGDNVVPYYTQQVSVIGIPTGLVASGSHDIHVRFDNLDIVNCFKSYPTNAHVGYLQTDQANALAFVANFMSALVCDEVVDCALSIGLAEFTSRSGLQVHPNPTTGPIRLELDHAARILLTDMSGRVLLAERFPLGTSHWDLGDLPNGAYIMRTEGPEPAVLRIIKVY